MPRPAVLAPLVAAVLVSGCGSPWQKNIDLDAPSLFRPGEGLILGSVTAPIIPPHHHETLIFHYRSTGDGGNTTGQLTSAALNWSMVTIPTCSEDGLTELCGRLFAVSLPAGDYEIHNVQEVGPPSYIYEMPPLRFTVAPGRASYLGNLHTSFCKGQPSRHRLRGAILGGDMLILDESQRDLAILEARYPQLTGAEIEKQLLPNLAWRWRVPWEPYDWGSCGSGQSADQ